MAVTRALLYATAAWLAVGAAVAGADPKEAHKLGVQAIEASRWADAARFFRAALAERSEEKVNRFLKTEYLPHYYLGVALAEQGDCRAALASWARSRQQGQIAKSRWSEDLDRRRTRCQSHLRHIEAAAAEVEQLLAKAEGAGDALAALARAPELAAVWGRGDPSLAARQEAAGRHLAEARRVLESGKKAADLERLDASKSLASRALDELQATLAAARDRRGELDAAAASALTRLEEAEQKGHRMLRSVSDLSPYPSRLAARVAAVEQILRKITDAKSAARARALEGMTEELTAAIGELRRTARRPPERLARAAEAFFSGAYLETIDLLEDEGLAASRRARPHVCLLRAASRHALWELSGRRDATLVEAAEEDLAACAEADALAPSPRFFSPRFVEFHRATLDALAAADAPSGGEEEPVADAGAEGGR